MKFIVVDDNKTFREGIKYYLENILSHQVIGLASDGLEFLKMPAYSEADIILMDIEMPGLNGVETVKKALWKKQSLRFIAITSYTDKAYLIDLISAGFKSCVFKNSIYESLEKAIHAVHNDKYFFPKEIQIGNDKYDFL